MSVVEAMHETPCEFNEVGAPTWMEEAFYCAPDRLHLGQALEQILGLLGVEHTRYVTVTGSPFSARYTLARAIPSWLAISVAPIP